MLNKIISTTIGLCISMPGWVSSLFSPPLPVRTSEQALLIGSHVAHEKFPNVNYNKYRLFVADGDNKPHIMGGLWCVYYELVDENGEIADVLGGGGPEIHIRKKDGKIVYANLQR